MIEEVLKKSKCFGVVMINSKDEIYHVGCSTEIIKIQEFDDGTIKILTRGRKRFKVWHYISTERAIR